MTNRQRIQLYKIANSAQEPDILYKQAGLRTMGKALMAGVGKAGRTAKRVVTHPTQSMRTAAQKVYTKAMNNPTMANLVVGTQLTAENAAKAGKAIINAPKNAVNAVKNAPRNIAKKVTSPGAFKASFNAGEKVGRGAATVAHAGATMAAHAGSAAAGAAKGFAQKGFVEPAAKWAAKHPGAAKAVKYTAAGLGAAAAIGGGAYAIQKAKENNVEYGSRQPPRYY